MLFLSAVSHWSGVGGGDWKCEMVCESLLYLFIDALLLTGHLQGKAE